MKLSKYLLTLLLATTCLADNQPIRNDTPTALRDLAANLNVGSNYAVNKYGQLQCLAVVGDSGATSAYHYEDVAAVSGDAGVGILAVRNDALGTGFSGTTGDYSNIAVDSTGAVYTRLFSVNSGQSVARPEDSAFGTGEGVMVTGAQAQDPLTVDQGSNGNVGPIKMDRTGRVMVGFAPHGEHWSSCGTATAVTSDVAIKASVASNRIYVSSITCKNTSSTTGTNLDFKDGTTIIAVGSIGEFTIAAANNGVNTYPISFPVPLRLTSATAFNFATNTAISSVTCCGAGFISAD